MSEASVIGQSAAPPTSQTPTKNKTEKQSTAVRLPSADEIPQKGYIPPASDLRRINIGAIEPSKTNPRKAFDTAADRELLESIRTHGVLLPVLVRPIDRQWRNGVEQESLARYELVAGERRYRCAVKAKLADLPAYVKELSDEQALELQIVENLQREDVTPLEEGSGYVALITSMRASAEAAVKALPESQRAAAWKKHNEAVTQASLVETVAKRIGKSVRYVYARMKLVELAPEVKAALASGKIEASHADEIVRLQPAQQTKALEFCCKDPDHYGGGSKNREQAPSVRVLKAFCREEAYTDLAKGCPFKLDDAKLVPAAGACDACPKLTGNNPLFAGQDVGKKVCTDPACYQQKKLALVKINVAAVAQKTGVEPVMISHEYRSGYDNRAKTQGPGVLYDGQYSTRGHDKAGKYGPIVKGSCDHAKLGIYVDAARGNVEEGAIGATVWICTAASGKCKVHDKSPASEAGRNNFAGGRRTRELQKEYRRLVYQAIAEKLKTPARDDLNLVAFEFFERLGNHNEQPIKKALGWPAATTFGRWNGRPALKKKIAAWSEPELLRHLVLFAIGNELNVASYADTRPADLLAVAARHKVDAAAILADVKARREKKTKPAAQTSAKAKLEKGQCAKCGCTPQHRCVVKGKKTCKLGEKGICTGPDCKGKPINSGRQAAKKGGR